MKKNLFERFRDGELGEIQKRAFSFASRSHLADEFYFLAGFFIGRHFDEVLQADMDDSEKKAQQKYNALHEDNVRMQKELESARTEIERLRDALDGYIKD